MANLTNPPISDTHSPEYPSTVYILITQCLQNSFFLDTESKLCLPENEALRMLVGSPEKVDPEIQDSPASIKDYVAEIRKGAFRENYRKIPKDILEAGPLYRFFEAVTQQRDTPLHIIQIKDWHQTSDSYDDERRLYGAHCEAETWSANAIEGYEKFLNPQWRYDRRYDCKIDRDGKITHYEVLSDSVFDFKPPYPSRKESKGAENHFDWSKKSSLAKVLDSLINPQASFQHVYIGVIGVLPTSR